MKRSEVEDRLADYAFGTMRPDERAGFEAELATHPDLLAEYEQTWQPLITALPLGAEQMQPSAEMRGRVLEAAFRGESVAVMTRAAEAGSTMQRSAEAGSTMQQAMPREAGLSWWQKLVVLFSRPQMAMPTLAAMLIVTLASMAWGLSSNATLAKERAYVATEQQELNELLAGQNVRTVAMQPTERWAGGVATAMFDPNGKAVYISLNGPLPQQALECQVWAVQGGQKVSLGTFPMNSAAAGYLMYAPTALKNYNALIVSWEQPGGAAQPTQDWIVVQGMLEN